MLLGEGPVVVRSGPESGREGLGMRGATDELLMSRVAESDDEDALSELYDRYGGLIYGAGIRYLGDRTLAEDLVQNVFLSVWRSAASFDHSRASFATLLRDLDLPHNPQPRYGSGTPPERACGPLRRSSKEHHLSRGRATAPRRP